MLMLLMNIDLPTNGNDEHKSGKQNTVSSDFLSAFVFSIAAYPVQYLPCLICPKAIHCFDGTITTCYNQFFTILANICH